MKEDQRTLVRFLIGEIEENMRANDVQRDFFESLCDFFDKRNFLTEKQIESLKRLHERVTR